MVIRVKEGVLISIRFLIAFQPKVQCKNKALWQCLLIRTLPTLCMHLYTYATIDRFGICNLRGKVDIPDPIIAKAEILINTAEIISCILV